MRCLKVRITRVRRLTQITEIQVEDRDLTARIPRRAGAAVPRVNEGELRVYLGTRPDDKVEHGFARTWREAIIPGRPIAVLLNILDDEGKPQVFHTTPIRKVRGIELREGTDGEKRPDLIRTQGTEYRIEWL